MTLENTIAVILSPPAGRVTPQVIAWYQAKANDRLHVFVPSNLAEVQAVARHVIEEEYGAVYLGGGDGTVSLYINAFLQENGGKPFPKIALSDLGTGRSYKHLIGIGDRRKQLEMLLDYPLQDLPQWDIPLIQFTYEQQGVRREMYHTFGGHGWDARVLDDYLLIKGKRWWKALDDVPSVGRTLVYVAAGFNAAAREIASLQQQGNVTITSSSPVLAFDKDDRLVSMAAEEAFLFDQPVQYVGVGTTPYFGFKFTPLPFALRGHHLHPKRMHLRVVTGQAWTLIPTIMMNLAGIWWGTYRGPSFHDFLVQDVTVTPRKPSHFQIAGDSKGKKTGWTAAMSHYALPLVHYAKMG